MMTEIPVLIGWEFWVGSTPPWERRPHWRVVSGYASSARLHLVFSPLPRATYRAAAAMRGLLIVLALLAIALYAPPFNQTEGTRGEG